MSGVGNQTDRQTDRYMYVQTDRQTGREAERKGNRDSSGLDASS